jgi:enterochelin esterase family protein
MVRKVRAMVLVLGLAVMAVPAEAQTPAGPAPAGRGAGRGGGRGGAPAVKSPEVSADGHVTVRLRAPNATDVLVAIGGQRVPMTKDDQGVWSATTGVLAPDYYTYAIVVDGASIDDPANRQVQTSFGSFQSLVVVPGPEPWFPQPGVARGAIARHAFHSAVANDDRDFFVYTPAGYDAHRAQPYPILVLLHGLGDDAERWMNGGAANVILDNLIAQGKAVPMVMVTTLGYGVSNGPAGAMAPENITGYTKILLDEILPRVEQNYNVSRDREQRAIAGLSMGGAETMYTGLNHLDTFAWMASFSGAYVMWPGANARSEAPPAGPGAPAAAAPGRGGRGGAQVMDEAAFAKNFPALDAKANARIRMLFIACGTADGLLGVNRQFKSWLTSKGVQFTAQEVPGLGHVWPLWRQNLTDVAQQLFQPRGR